MKRIRSIAIAVVTLAGISLLAIPSANAGTRVSVNIGSSYCARPTYYQTRPYYARPVVRQPVYYKPVRHYYNNPGYYNNNYRAPVHYNHSRPVYYRR